jgi:hypothetical protein
VVKIRGIFRQQSCATGTRAQAGKFSWKIQVANALTGFCRGVPEKTTSGANIRGAVREFVREIVLGCAHISNYPSTKAGPSRSLANLELNDTIPWGLNERHSECRMSSPDVRGWKPRKAMAASRGGNWRSRLKMESAQRALNEMGLSASGFCSKEQSQPRDKISNPEFG